MKELTVAPITVGGSAGWTFARARRKIPHMLVVGTVLFAASGYVVSRLPARYSSEALVRVNDRTTRIMTGDAVVGSLGADMETIQSEVQVLKSPELLDRVVKKLNLETRPGYHPQTDGEKSFADQAMAQVKTALDWAERQAGFEFKGATEANEPPAVVAERILAKELVVQPVGRSRVISIQMTSTDPALAAQIINTLAESYTAAQVGQKERVARDAQLVLEKRIGDLASQAQADDEAVEKFQIDKNIYKSGDVSLPLQQLESLSKALAVAKTDADDAVSRVATATGPLGGASTSEVLQNQLVQRLIQDQATMRARETASAKAFGENHPATLALGAQVAAINARVSAETRKIVDGLRADAQIKQDKVQNIERQIVEATDEISRSRREEVSLRGLQRRSDASRSLLQELLKRQQEVLVQQSTQLPDSTIVSLASETGIQVFPNRRMLLGVAGLLSFGLAGFLFYLRGIRDRSVWDSSDLREFDTVRSIGIIPRLRASASRNSPNYAIAKPRSAYSEAIHRIAASVYREGGTSGGVVTLVTSALSGEGKTSTALAMGRLAAASGRKVLVIDADGRGRSMQQLTQMRTDFGFAEYVAGAARLRDVIQRDIRSDVDVMSAGGKGAYGRATASPFLEQRLADIRRQYDFIVVDAAPTVAVTDAHSLASFVDFTVFLIRWGSTSRDIVATELTALAEAGARRLGVVLTMVPESIERRAGALKATRRAYYLD